jgi:ABC-type branched-subunit amino acid transport system substrate-binding protein
MPKMLDTPHRWFESCCGWPWRACATLPLLLVIGACSSLATPPDSESPSTPTAQIIEVPVTVEVTRLEVTERIVQATPSPPTRCAPASLDATDVVTVSALLPLSNPSRLASSLAVQAALALAVDNINRFGNIPGKSLRLVVEDAGSDAQQAAAATDLALFEHCASALIASLPSDAASAALDVAHRHTTPLVLVDGSADSLTESQLPEIFRLGPSATMLDGAFADWLEAVGDYNGDGDAVSLLITDDTDAGLARAQAVSDRLAAHGIRAESLSIEMPASDFSSLIARIVVRDTMADSILILTNGESSLLLQQQLLENGIGPSKDTLLVQMSTALRNPTFWETVGEEGAFTVGRHVGPVASSLGEVGNAFESDMAPFVNQWPPWQSFLAHDAIYLLRDAILRSPSLEGADLIRAMEETDMQGAAGTIRFPVNSAVPPADDGAPAWQWHQWLDHPIHFVQFTAPNQSFDAAAAIWPPDAATVEGPVVRPAPGP